MNYKGKLRTKELMNNFGLGFIALIVMSFSLNSCKLIKHKSSKKDREAAKLTKQIADSTNLAIKAELNSKDSTLVVNNDNVANIDSASILNKELLMQTSAIWQKRIEFKTFSAKAKMHYEGGDKSFDFVANIRIRKDSIIWVSVNVAGLVQVARAIITPDSFKAIIYTEKEAYQGPISKANQILPEGLDFFSLQNLLLGNPILKQESASSVSEEAQNWIVRLLENNYIEQLAFDKVDSTLRGSNLITQGNSNKSLNHLMSNYSNLNNNKIALDRKLNILTDSSTMIVEMSYSNLSMDNELSYPFSIPKNYTLK